MDQTIDLMTPDHDAMQAIREERAHYIQARNHCPFGCQMGDMDEYGYCQHLVGFTNDGKTYEAIIQRKSKQIIDGETVLVDGNKFVSGQKTAPVLKTDRLINPVVKRIIDGALHHIKAWASARVYRENPAEAPSVVSAAPQADPELVLLQKRLAELEAKAQKKRLLAEIDRLEKELGPEASAPRLHQEPTDEELEKLTAPK